MRRTEYMTQAKYCRATEKANSSYSQIFAENREENEYRTQMMYWRATEKDNSLYSQIFAENRDNNGINDSANVLKSYRQAQLFI